jgi:hypothetical protein
MVLVRFPDQYVLKEITISSPGSAIHVTIEPGSHTKIQFPCHFFSVKTLFVPDDYHSDSILSQIPSRI